jgi:hypothetical protein
MVTDEMNHFRSVNACFGIVSLELHPGLKRQMICDLAVLAT